jgi:hypothetical protein
MGGATTIADTARRRKYRCGRLRRVLRKPAECLVSPLLVQGEGQERFFYTLTICEVPLAQLFRATSPAARDAHGDLSSNKERSKSLLRIVLA